MSLKYIALGILIVGTIVTGFFYGLNVGIWIIAIFVFIVINSLFSAPAE